VRTLSPPRKRYRQTRASEAGWSGNGLLMFFVSILVFCQKDGLERREGNIAKFVDLTVDEALHLKTGNGISCGGHDRVLRNSP